MLNVDVGTTMLNVDVGTTMLKSTRTRCSIDYAGKQ